MPLRKVAWEVAKAVPLGVLLPLALLAASVKPQDVALNLAAWLPSDPAAATNLAYTALFFAIVYFFSAYAIPALRRKPMPEAAPSEKNPLTVIIAKRLTEARNDLLKIPKSDLSFQTLSAWQERVGEATRLAHASGINLHNPISQHLGALQHTTDPDTLDAVRVRIVGMIQYAIGRLG